jgi:hypothetical protein
MTIRYFEVASNLQREFVWPAHNRGIWYHTPKAPRFRTAPTWMALLTRCSLLNTRSRCSADPCPMTLPGAASTDFSNRLTKILSEIRKPKPPG